MLVFASCTLKIELFSMGLCSGGHAREVCIAVYRWFSVWVRTCFVFFSVADGSRYVGVDIGSFSEGFCFRWIR